ncbi:Crp/Fnr family transcriptional regulator [Rhizobium lemnae]|uniref:Cyclic nucleotide-binding domain-containing protein n=1 Tax=Rhizobium lemnae TaxID=1214924 RepID=A0ABV8EEN6_9HYPH|nr:Crp/Fnr family transcriptional regulator [Rhizobium lemnae]MCJ8507889.1 Crp/Fnr family transcriptional regulator [Rhizobium lemnae]
MLLREEVELLRNIPYFNRVDPCKLKLLAFASYRISYEPGDAIFMQGDFPEATFVLLSGNVRLTASSPCGRCETTHAEPNSMLGEMCLLSDQPRAMTATALTNVEALKIGRDCLLRLVSDNPRMSFEISRVLAETLRDRIGGVGKRFSQEAVL